MGLGYKDHGWKNEGTEDSMKKFIATFVMAFILVFSTPMFAVQQTATQALTIVVAAPLVITSTAPPEAIVGQAYSYQLTATGGVAPYTWTLASGFSLPAGVTLSSTGLISGTPTASGSVSFSVICTDSGK